MNQLSEKELIKIRHELHKNPELSHQEFETTRYLASKLREWGINYSQEGLKTGLVAEIGQGYKSLAIRSDIDALPIVEKTGLTYASENNGVMHACGHDVHQTALLGAAYYLKQIEKSLSGRVKLIFQAAEESHDGAEEVIAAGYLDGVSGIVGFHNNPSLSTGEISIGTGGVMAAVDQFIVTIHGKGSHAANPDLGKDPIVALAGIVNAIQTIVSRNVNPQEISVVSITHIQSGNTWNVLPEEAKFEGTIRTFDSGTQQLVKNRFSNIIKQISGGYGVTADIRWIDGPPVTYNDPELTEFLKKYVPDELRIVETLPSNAGEDFAFYQKHIPGVFAFLGTNSRSTWHHDDFFVDDSAIDLGVKWFVSATKGLLDYTRRS